MLLHTSRFALRDFLEKDRAAFLACQMDPWYRRLYDLGEAHERQVHDLFDLFVSWQREEPRLNVQIGVSSGGQGDCADVPGCAGRVSRRDARFSESSPVLMIGADTGRRSRLRARFSSTASMTSASMPSPDGPRAARRTSRSSPAGSAPMPSRDATDRIGWPRADGRRSTGPWIAALGSAPEDEPAARRERPLRLCLPAVRSRS